MLCRIIKSQSHALFFSSCGFVHLEPGVFIKGSSTNKTHQNIKAPEESIDILLKSRHQEHFERKGILGEISAHQLAWAVAPAVMVAAGVQVVALNREYGVSSALVGDLGCNSLSLSLR